MAIGSSAKKDALLQLRKQVQQLIAQEHAEDPQGAQAGEQDAAQAMDDSGMGAEQPNPEPTSVQSAFMDYMKPKTKPRRPGTGVMMGSAASGKGQSQFSHRFPSKKQMMGSNKREVG